MNRPVLGYVRARFWFARCYDMNIEVIEEFADNVRGMHKRMLHW